MILSGRDLAWYIECGKLKIEPCSREQFQQNGFDCILDGAERKNDHFYLGCTREVLTLPDDLMAFVALRSTWARRGFFVPPTIVDAGFSANLTLEIGLLDTAQPLPIGQRFAHLVFARTTGPCDPYRGKYQHQTGITEAKP